MTIEEALYEMKLLRKGAEVNGHTLTAEAFDVIIKFVVSKLNSECS